VRVITTTMITAFPAFNAQLADQGGTPLAGSPAEFGRLIADDTEKMGKVIRLANINVEWAGPRVRARQAPPTSSTQGDSRWWGCRSALICVLNP
jgi:hypothetical protein